MKYSQWLQSLSDQELMGLYHTHCGQSETPCDTISEFEQAIWFAAFDRGLI